jgi:ABC-type multidrug transport system fused ATPase/permease subunit
MKNFWRKLWTLIDESHQSLKMLAAWLVVLEVVKLGGPYALKLIIDTLLVSGITQLEWLLVLTATMFIAENLQALVGWRANRLILYISTELEYYLPNRIQQKFLQLSLGYHERENTGNKITKVQRGVDHIADLIRNMSWEVMPTAIQMLVTLVILLIVDWRLSAVFIVTAPLFLWVTYRVNKSVKRKREYVEEEWERSSGKMTQAIINVNTVQSFVQEPREAAEYANIRENIRANEWQIWGKVMNFAFVRDVIVNTGRAATLLMGIWLVLYGQVTVGTLVFVVTVSEKAFFSLFRLSRFYDRIQDSVEAVNRFVALSQEEPEIKNPPQGKKPRSVQGEVVFDGVGFSYDATHEKALDDVSLTLEPGTVNAFVGPSGGGKSTVVKMMYRHYDPDEGSVMLDGIDLRKYDLHGFRKHMAIVPQEVEIFNGSLRENIAYANPRASFGAIKRAAQIANVEEFVNKLADGYDTEVGERGVKLSGGQRQRLGIARALLADPKILIFDEATSNLDSQSERLIQEAMDRVSNNRTVILIAHRLSTIRHADQIFVMENGTVVEQGSHSELSNKKGGLYAKLVGLQATGDVD